MKIDRVLTNKEEVAAEERLYKAIMSLRNLDEYRAFFGDIFIALLFFNPKLIKIIE